MPGEGNMIGKILAALLSITMLSRSALASEQAAAHHSDGAHGSQVAEQKPKFQPLFEGLGNVHHPVTTASPRAQRYFDQGLAFNYGFNHDEAYLSFEAAAQIDPKMAMAQWGAALVLGPNYNLPGNEDRMKLAYDSIRRAQSLEGSASPEERDLIEALAKRYGSDGKQTPAREKDYADAMREVAHRYPDDPDVQALFAEAMMDLRPWQLWTADGKPAPGTEEIVATLENGLKKHPDHLGLNHYLIHAVEASQHPERAMAAANRLGPLAPAMGHLVHMPSHIYVRTGRYHQAAEANQQAIAADKKFLALSGETGMYPLMYYTHNIQFLCYSQMMEGRKKDAIASARDLEKNVPIEAVRQMPMAEFITPMPYFAMVRFGAWDDMLKEPAPPKDLTFTAAMWHYARGVAFAATGEPGKAKTERAELDLIARGTPASRVIGDGTSARQIMELASSALAGAIDSAVGNHKLAAAQYRRAVEIQDTVAYTEPPIWYYPVRESLGAELLAGGRAADAEAVYQRDLVKNPENPRSLYGLAQALHAQGRDKEAASVEKRFSKAWAYADVRLGSQRIAQAEH